MIVMVSEGVFTLDKDGKKVPYGEILRERIEAQTGVETKFARLAHVVRGGSPSQRDRLTATKMGVHAVELLLAGKSNLVVIEDRGNITSMNIVLALTIDRMYKNKLKDGDLKGFPGGRNRHDELRAQRRSENLYKMAYDICGRTLRRRDFRGGFQ